MYLRGDLTGTLYICHHSEFLPAYVSKAHSTNKTLNTCFNLLTQDTGSSSSSSSGSGSDSDSSSSSDDEEGKQSGSGKQGTGAARNRDGTNATATKAEMKLAAQLAKDPWGRCVWGALVQGLHVNGSASHACDIGIG